jgi:hypothetical protein
VKKTLGLALVVARNETFLSFSKFVQNSDKSKEDSFAIDFFYKTASIFQRFKLNAKVFYDLLGFHKWFEKLNDRVFKQEKRKNKAKIGRCKKEIAQVVDVYLGVNGLVSQNCKKLISGEIHGFEFSHELFLFVDDTFEDARKCGDLERFNERLLVLSGIVANNPKETKIIYYIFHIILLKNLGIAYFAKFNEQENLLFNYKISIIPTKKSILPDTFLISILKFLENQFNLNALQKKPEILQVSQIFQSLLQTSSLRSPETILNLCELSLKISDPIHNLKNSESLYILSIEILFRLNPASYSPENLLLKKYLKLMKVIIIQLVITSPIESSEMTYSYKESLMYVLSLNLFNSTEGSNKL